ncbi:uncharacterized protein LOC111252038 isoform X2 [Varroa destructor]|uniref:Uncharacterized protein n=1 Tax=Varroa destructor TaxID=109461 RepID=A0A7M7MBY3_VARDE|nr:uncharacterized protein LOC111252038 isoform X2 [Varroa destructor]
MPPLKLKSDTVNSQMKVAINGSCKSATKFRNEDKENAATYSAIIKRRRISYPYEEMPTNGTQTSPELRGSVKASEEDTHSNQQTPTIQISRLKRATATFADLTTTKTLYNNKQEIRTDHSPQVHLCAKRNIGTRSDEDRSFRRSVTGDGLQRTSQLSSTLSPKVVNGNAAVAVSRFILSGKSSSPVLSDSQETVKIKPFRSMNSLRSPPEDSSKCARRTQGKDNKSNTISSCQLMNSASSSCSIKPQEMLQVKGSRSRSSARSLTPESAFSKRLRTPSFHGTRLNGDRLKQQDIQPLTRTQTVIPLSPTSVLMPPQSVRTGAQNRSAERNHSSRKESSADLQASSETGEKYKEWYALLEKIRIMNL